MNERQYGKSIASQVLKKYKISQATLDDLVYIATDNGYEIIDYNTKENSQSVLALINNLSVQSYIEAGTAFTYQNNDVKLIFLCEMMSNEEKLYALAHELGHIFCKHFSASSPLGYYVKDEHEANEFAHYILKPTALLKSTIFARKHKWLLIGIISAIIIIIATLFIWKYTVDEKPYYKEYYVTTNGEKYHKKDCIVIKDRNNIKRLTEKDMRKNEYEPCQVCLP